MELHVTLASAPPSAFPAREIVVDTTALATGAALAGRLQAAGYAGPFTVGGTPLAALDPHDGTLVQGAVIVCGAQCGPDVPARLPHLLLVVHSGPDAGQVIPLTRGAYTIGRAAADIVISDPALSRHHALLTVARDAILVEDLGSVNGTFVDGVSVKAAPVPVAATLRLGASRCSIELIDGPSWTPPGTPDVLDPLPVGVELPDRPSPVIVLTALLPLMLGVVLAVTTGMWFFLAFSAVSAVTGLIPLLVYRRRASSFADAVHHAAERDGARRSTAVPDPGRTAVDALRAADPRLVRTGGAAPTDTGPVLLRIGLADQPARLSIGRTDTSFPVPLLRDIPLLVPCSSSDGAIIRGRFTISGGTDTVEGIARALLLQVAHPRSTAVPIVCWGASDALPLPARFLPNVRLTRDPLVLAASLAEGAGKLLVFQFSPVPPDLIGPAEVFVIRVLPGAAPAAAATATTAGTRESCLTITAGGARAWIGGLGYDVVPDAVSARAFDRTARALARAAASAGCPPSGAPGAGMPVARVLPSSASLWSADATPEALPTSVPDRWAASGPERPTALLGMSTRGTLSLDLVKDGPHLLVAGTTGSGKSELLRTLVLGFALDQPPEHLAMLLIDYKGGSGLGTLAELPHCVGYLTDLSSESTGRALTSLRAELRRREGLCAAWGAHDLAELRTAMPPPCPPRLVVVIDEFRMLGEDVPTAVPDLMRIAALGRSLGVHLVLATQRVQGAVTPELRANITSAVLLRVQTAMESQELLGSAEAARISVDTPGRAFLRRGAEAPVEFQVASSTEPWDPSAVPGWQDLSGYLRDAAPLGRTGRWPAKERPAPSPARTSSRGTLLEQAVAALTAVAGPGTGTPFRPVLPPLPAQVSTATCGTFRLVDPGSAGQAMPDTAVVLGVADYPERQEQRLLTWSPAQHSHLALIGLPGSGVAQALSSLVASLPAADPDVHLYVLDGDGSLAGCSTSAHVGAYVRSGETRRAGRVLGRLRGLPLGGTGDGTRIVLVVTGWARWCSQFRQDRSSRGEEDLHAVVHDGAADDVAVLIDGDRELTASRYFALIPNRVYLPLGAHQETTLTWPRMPHLDAVPGRGFVQGRITGGSGEGACQLVLADTAAPFPGRPPAVSPFPVHALPTTVDLDRLHTTAPVGAEPEPDGLALGVFGDDLRPYCLRVGPGEAYLVLGRGASGRTTALRVLAASASRCRPPRTVLAPPFGASIPERIEYWRRLFARLPDGICSTHLLLVDDADQLPTDLHGVLSALVAGGAAAVLAARPGPSLPARVPLSLRARSTGRGLVLAPEAPGDGDFFGVRLEIEGTCTPGRGYVCEPSGVVEIQVARHPGDPRRDRSDPLQGLPGSGRAHGELHHGPGEQGHDDEGGGNHQRQTDERVAGIEVGEGEDHQEQLDNE